ncbi:MAG: hypothetical protein Q8S11_01995 [Daejeonella sp.]|uniref:hypothetical protein n=1 Tax=Daejeonella sp. TaxID=2805397 RepID=UPI002734FF36|nr:hypothetical protein [Daejeonella sp.]MDP3467075.1 hypothetical protein [Daejeonella sp.]
MDNAPQPISPEVESVPNTTSVEGESFATETANTKADTSEGISSLAGNTGETDHPKPEQTDHLKGWRRLPNFAGEDFQFSADLV